MLAMRSLRAAMADDQAFLNYPFERILFKIGMRNTNPETDWRGDFVLSSQVWTTARDLARLGLLYVNDGVWNGERLLPEGWAAYVRTPAPQQPATHRADGSRILGYGAQFWITKDRFAEVPDDMYVMLGNRGQIVAIVPSQELVLVRRGFDGPPGELVDGVANQRFDAVAFAAAVLAALDG